MKRRDFMAGVAASILFTRAKGSTQTSPQSPRLLISNTDPFTGLGLLKTRYTSGMRPSDDMEGWALSWQISRQENFAEKAVAAMRAGHITKGVKPSRSWVDYARWSLAFDWLSGYPGFEPALRNRIALVSGCSSCALSCANSKSRCGGEQWRNASYPARFAIRSSEAIPSCQSVFSLLLPEETMTSMY